MKKIKYKLYYLLAERNHHIKSEYQSYIDTNADEHVNNRWKSWLLLLKLNFDCYVLQKENLTSKNKNNNIVKPYLKGAESAIFKREKPYHLASELMEYEIISFDIFDTLLLRPFKKPIDLFQIIGQRLEFTGSDDEFTTIRCKAEAEARQIAQKSKRTSEVNIYDIYKIVNKYTDIPIKKGVETEFQVELDYCFPNPYMKEVFEILREQGKTLIITTDMYFAKKHIEKLLLENGFYGYEKLYVSCEYEVSKGSGKLFQHIKEDFKCTSPSKITHIGDNKHNDIVMGKKNGLSTNYFANVHDIGNKYRPKNISKPIESFYGGIVNTHIYNGTKEYSIYYEFGFIYIGLYVYGMTKWLYDKCLDENIDKILFTSKSSFILKEVFDNLYGQVNNSYEYWSKNATMKYFSLKRDFEKVLYEYLQCNVNNNRFTIRNLLYSLNIDDNITEKNKDTLYKYLLHNKDYIINKYKKSEKYIFDIFKSSIDDAKNIALVDGSCNIENLIALKKFIQEDIKLDCKIKSFLTTSKNNDILLDELEVYLVENNYNSQFINLFEDNYSEINKNIFQLAFESNEPYFMGIDENFEFIFDKPLIENYKVVQEIQRGILDFCKIYHQKSEKDIYLRNVKALDAYYPISLAFKELENFQKILKI